MKKQVLLLVVLALATLVPAMSITAQDSLIESVCLITDIGQITDGTFNQSAYEGMQLAAEEFDLDTTFIETQAQTDYAANINTCVEEGYDAIITVGFLLGDATLAAATENPDIYFMNVDNFVADGPENLIGLLYREDQAGFLAGALAAMMTETDIIAGVYGIDIPPVVKFRNGFEQGAKYINPEISILGVYIDDFQAPDRGASAAAQFLGEGADVIFGAGGPTGSGGIIYAACPQADCEGAALVIGVDKDEYLSTFGEGETPGSENLISSAVKRVDNSVYLALEILVNGGEGWPAGDNITMTAEIDGVGFAPPHDADVPEEVLAAMDEIYAGLQDGSIDTGVDPITGELLEMTAEATEEASG